MATRTNIKDIDQKQLEEAIISICVEDSKTHTDRSTSLRKVAKELKLPLEVVYKYYNTHPVGSKIKEQIIKQKQQETIVEKINTATITTPVFYIPNKLPDSAQTSKELVFAEEDDLIPGEYHVLTDDQIIDLCIDYYETTMAVKDIQKKYRISYKRLYEYLREYGEGEENMRGKGRGHKKRGPSKNKKVSVEELREKYVTTSTPAIEEKIIVDAESEAIKEGATNEEVSVDEDKTINLCENVLLSIDNISLIKREEKVDYAGLCADRHDMPVDRFIFNVLDEKEMFDYDKLYDHASNWLKENVTSGNLYLYMTGMQCILAAVIKACHDQEIGLSLLHRNASKQIYEKQMIWDSKTVSELDAAAAKIRRKGPMYLSQNPINTDKFYTISINKVLEFSDGFEECCYAVLPTVDEAFALYSKSMMKIQEYREKEKLCVFMSECHIDKEQQRFMWDMNLSKSYNFK